MHMMNNATVHPVRIELEEVTPIRPLRAVALQFPAAEATDEWPIPSAPLSLALAPELARELAHAILAAADQLES